MLCDYHYNADRAFDAGFQAESLRKRARTERCDDARLYLLDRARRYDSSVRACKLIETTLTPGPEPCAVCKLDRLDAQRA